MKVSTLISTDRLIPLSQVPSVPAQPSAEVGLWKTYRCSKYELKRCVFDYVVNYFRFYDLKPPLCSTPMLRFFIGTPVGHLVGCYGESNRLLYLLNGAHVHLEDAYLYVYSIEGPILALMLHPITKKMVQAQNLTQ